jgi:hypothetical protein
MWEIFPKINLFKQSRDAGGEGKPARGAGHQGELFTDDRF